MYSLTLTGISAFFMCASESGMIFPNRVPIPSMCLLAQRNKGMGRMFKGIEKCEIMTHAPLSSLEARPLVHGVGLRIVLGHDRPHLVDVANLFFAHPVQNLLLVGQILRELLRRVARVQG